MPHDGVVNKRFQVCDLNQPFLLPPSLDDWLPEDHLARFVADVMNCSGSGLKPCKLAAEFELPSGKVSCAYKCGHWPGGLISATCDPGQKCKEEIPGGWVSKETACE